MLHVEETMTTARQNPPGQPPTSANDLLLAEAMELTSHDYRDELAGIGSEPKTDEARASAGRMLEAIRSDALLSPFADRPKFVEWARYKAADDSKKDVSEVSADEAKAALDAPRGTLVTHLLAVLERRAKSSPGYVRDPLKTLLDDPRAWEGRVGEFMSAAVDDIHVAREFGVNVLDVARDRGLALFDVLDAVKQARLRVISDTSWRKAPDPAAGKAAMFRDAFEAKLTARETTQAAAVAGSEMSSCGPWVCAVSTIALHPAVPQKMGWARRNDPCNSMDYLRYLVYTHAIGEDGHLFQAGELFVDRWAQATNWCWPEEPAGQTERSEANCQSFDDRIYWLRRRNARTDTAYAVRAEIYQEQLKSPAIQQAWSNFVSQVQGYLSARCCEATTIPSYRCLGVYTAAEALRRAAAGQLTGLARMQIKELAGSLQRVFRLFTDPRVIELIDPAAAGCQPPSGTATYIGKGPADQTAVVAAVTQQLLGSKASGLYQAWDKAFLLDQVFAWVQCGHAWSPDHGCEEDLEFVKMLGAMSALLPGAGQVSSASPASLITATT
jgi:hypothetical protein